MTEENMQKLLSLIKQFEGFRAELYRCSENKLTIGYGHNCEAHNDIARYQNRSLTESEATELLKADLQNAIYDCEKRVVFFKPLLDVQKAVLIDMCFNMGIASLLKFSRMLQAMSLGDMKQASREIYYSKMARQTDREGVLMYMLLTGEFMER